MQVSSSPESDFLFRSSGKATTLSVKKMDPSFNVQVLSCQSSALNVSVTAAETEILVSSPDDENCGTT